MTKKFIKEITKTNRLYEVEFDGNLYYQIAHTENGTAGTFNHDYTLVERVEGYIKEHRRSLYKDAKNRLVFAKSSDGTPAISLASFLYHCYHGMPIEQVRSAKVEHVGTKYLPDGSEDCRKQSLVHMSGVQYKTDSREFRPVTLGGAEFMELRMNACTRFAYIENDPVLVDLLADTSLFSNIRYNGRTGIQAELKGATREAPYIHQIACAVKMGLLTRETFSDLDKIIEQIKENDEKQIDHLDTDVFNNVYHNLSIMPRGINGEKRGLTAADFGRYRTVWAYDWDSGSYLVMISESGERQHFYRCSNEADLLNLIENLIGYDEMTERLAYKTTLDAEGQPVSVPLPGRIFKDSGNMRSHPKIEANTALSVENGAALLALYRSSPERFAPWTNTSGGLRLSADGLSAVLAMLGMSASAEELKNAEVLIERVR